MHNVVIVFLPSYKQFLFSFAVTVIRDFIITIHLNVILQQDVHCLLGILALQILTV